MTKSKTTFRFRKIILALFILAIIRIVYFMYNYKFYSSSGTAFGTVTMVLKKDDYTVINIKANINYKAYIYTKNDIDYGDYISFVFENKDVNRNTIFNTFNYKTYLKSKNINQVIEIKSYKKLSKKTYYAIRGEFYKKVLKRKSASYILTFLCGDKSYIDTDVKMSFTNNGISHLLCVSGFHVAFITSFLNGILLIIFRKPKNAHIVILIFLSIYLMLADFMIALFRASIMYFLKIINNTYKLKIRLIYIFLFTLFLSISIWPQVIYDVSFYYTFILTLFLVLYGVKLDDNLFKVSIYSFIISTPLTLFLNYSINLLSFLYSIISSFFVCYVLYPISFLAVFFKLFDKILYKLSYYFEIVNNFLDEIDVFRIVVPKISVFVVILTYIIYLIYVIKPNKICMVSFVTFFIYILFNRYLDNSTYIYYLDVKQGDMSLIVSNHYSNVTFIDAGGTIYDDYLKYTVKQFLYSLGVRKIDSIVLTHGDNDHMKEAFNLIENFKIKNVIFNCGEYNDLEKKLIKVLEKKKIKHYSCIKELNVDKYKLEFLNTKEYDNENDNSNVIYFNYNNYKFLFMGDAGIEKEKDILDKYNLENIDFLKVGHHGSNTSSSEYFINSVNPKYSLISVGKNNRYGHPKDEVLDTLSNSKIYRTDLDGSIEIKLNKNGYKIRTCPP